MTVWMTSYFTCLDSAALHMFNQPEICLFACFQTSLTGGQQYSDILLTN